MNQHYVPEDPDLRPYGYAPGQYTSRCLHQGCQSTSDFMKGQKGYFVGDKRAWRCKPCAIEARNYALSAPASRAVRAPQLVRDKMRPREGVNEANTLLDKPQAVMGLINKCFLEMGEVALDLTNPDEYGDVLEALISLGEANGVSESAINEARRRKNDAKGRLSNNFWTPDHFMEPKA
ncbi:hypothetical protein [Mesorhizobium sp.]|uniref:hypothetical protein n=1 Tax=Mesorhizobium sp. TaxID=1871066 RepID=UPI000FE68E34|nr:hypothetical protein [Mesorhizobium sp.]RWI35469.1 MAG: hypothetical protein EOR14_28620 [Mesorhizobium sp.]RWJ66362.1 MAG: hypothetical protein EOR34_28515 [Mesorhizobium sp.]